MIVSLRQYKTLSSRFETTDKNERKEDLCTNNFVVLLPVSQNLKKKKKKKKWKYG